MGTFPVSEIFTDSRFIFEWLPFWEWSMSGIVSAQHVPHLPRFHTPPATKTTSDSPQLRTESQFKHNLLKLGQAQTRNQRQDEAAGWRFSELPIIALPGISEE
jgi:hypothetical protein